MRHSDASRRFATIPPQSGRRIIGSREVAMYALHAIIANNWLGATSKSRIKPMSYLTIEENIAHNLRRKLISIRKVGGIYFIRVGSWRISICKVKG